MSSFSHSRASVWKPDRARSVSRRPGSSTRGIWRAPSHVTLPPVRAASVSARCVCVCRRSGLHVTLITTVCAVKGAFHQLHTSTLMCGPVVCGEELSRCIMGSVGSSVFVAWTVFRKMLFFWRAVKVRLKISLTLSKRLKLSLSL